MKQQHMLTSFIKSGVIMLLCSTLAFSQNEEKEEALTNVDSVVFKQKYGLRLGVDLSKLVRTAIDDDYSGFEIMGDYRLTKTIYLAGELGNEERNTINEVLDNTTNGSYFKAGIDINMYKNWLDMENMIYAGFRGGFSSFSQTLNSFDIYNVNNQYLNDQFTFTEGQEFDGLTAIWAELQLGIKAELLNNFFAGINVQLKYLLSETEPAGFENLYIPGYNRTYDSGQFGAGYGFNVSYLIPIFKKDKVVLEEKEAEE